MENIGKEPRPGARSGAWPRLLGWQGVSSTYEPERGRLRRSFRVYAIEWEPDAIRCTWTTRCTRASPEGPAGDGCRPSLFHHLNVAVGRYWPGALIRRRSFRKHAVDYVRVYGEMGARCGRGRGWTRFSGSSLTRVVHTHIITRHGLRKDRRRIRSAGPVPADGNVQNDEKGDGRNPSPGQSFGRCSCTACRPRTSSIASGSHPSHRRETCRRRRPRSVVGAGDALRTRVAGAMHRTVHPAGLLAIFP